MNTSKEKTEERRSLKRWALVTLAVLLVAGGGIGAYLYYAMIARGDKEPEAKYVETNTNPVCYSSEKAFTTDSRRLFLSILSICLSKSRLLIMSCTLAENPSM